MEVGQSARIYETINGPEKIKGVDRGARPSKTGLVHHKRMEKPVFDGRAPKSVVQFRYFCGGSWCYFQHTIGLTLCRRTRRSSVLVALWAHSCVLCDESVSLAPGYCWLSRRLWRCGNLESDIDQWPLLGQLCHAARAVRWTYVHARFG